MIPTNFAKYLTEFLSVYLPSQKNVSKNTIYSYRDTFKLLINFCKERKNVSSEQITLGTLSSELITDFLEWIEVTRKCIVSPLETKDLRLYIHFLDIYKQKNRLGCLTSRKLLLSPLSEQKKL